LSAPLTGRGIHGGRSSSVWLHRAEGPLRFRSGGVEVVADVDRVVDTERCTVLGDGGVRIAVVEHLLAACRAAGFWSGLLVEVAGDELPILDGSAAPWAARLAELGPPPPTPPALAPATPLVWRDGSTEVAVTPGPAWLEVSVAFAHPSIGEQRWSGAPSDFATLLAARTFGFRHELEALRAHGLAEGAVPGSGILFDDAGPSTPLRFPDEPVRHKALDAVGDFALLGRPLAAGLRIHRGSHRAHVAAMRLLRRSPTRESDRP
jgi:UDP-3-O-[3-hydroxymyristoyl] N-acetylglucosamine deacetylase